MCPLLTTVLAAYRAEHTFISPPCRKPRLQKSLATTRRLRGTKGVPRKEV